MTTPRPPADSRLETLEREVARLAQVAGRTATREPNQGFPPQIRLAETWSSLPENYPASGNTFDIRFLDGALDVWSPGQRTATYTPRSLTTQTVAHVVDDRWFPRLTRVRVLQQNRKWWILDAVPPVPKAYVAGSKVFAGTFNGTFYEDYGLELHIIANGFGGNYGDLLEEYSPFGVDSVRFPSGGQGVVIMDVSIEPIPFGPSDKTGWFNVALNSTTAAQLTFIGAAARFPISQSTLGSTYAWHGSFAGAFFAVAAGSFNVQLQKYNIDSDPTVTVRLQFLANAPS
jgi:hypothetical protein